MFCCSSGGGGVRVYLTVFYASRATCCLVLLGSNGVTSPYQVDSGVGVGRCHLQMFCFFLLSFFFLPGALFADGFEGSQKEGARGLSAYGDRPTCHGFCSNKPRVSSTLAAPLGPVFLHVRFSPCFTRLRYYSLFTGGTIWILTHGHSVFCLSRRFDWFVRRCDRTCVGRCFDLIFVAIFDRSPGFLVEGNLEGLLDINWRLCLVPSLTYWERVAVLTSDWIQVRFGSMDLMAPRSETSIQLRMTASGLGVSETRFGVLGFCLRGVGRGTDDQVFLPDI